MENCGRFVKFTSVKTPVKLFYFACFTLVPSSYAEDKPKDEISDSSLQALLS